MANISQTRHAFPPEVRRAPGNQGTNAGSDPVNSGVKSEALACLGGGQVYSAELVQAVAPLSLILLLDTSGLLA